MFIYKITNQINNKIYIGQTIQLNPLMRWYRHLSNARLNVNGILYSAIRKYEKHNFVFEVIYTANNLTELNEKEIEFIALFQSTKKQFGYNIVAGGNNVEMTEESKLKLSKTLKKQFKQGRKPFKRFGMVPWNKGLKLPKNLVPKSEETRKKLSKANTGKKRSQETKNKLSLKQKEYHKNNISSCAKKVLCIDTNQIFNSASEASRYFNFPVSAVAKVCNGRKKHYKKLTFKYITETNNA